MERNNITNTLLTGERIASIYADTFLNDDYCNYIKPDDETSETIEKRHDIHHRTEDVWQSPSDLLIGILDLTPPFTSKITRGKTHEGILAIGEDLLNKERVRFLNFVNKLLHENEIAWSHILEHEKIMVANKVKQIYQEILETKSKTLMNEINTFYESSLQDLENHIRAEVTDVLKSAHASIINDLNVEIKNKLEKEKHILDKTLQKRYDGEVKKINHYYKILLDHENYRNNKLINQALQQRNDAIKAFCRQIEAENLTSTMYVMCTERKKCKIKQFILDNYHSAEIAEKLRQIKERQDIIDSYKTKEKNIYEINKEWEEKIKKILQLFLKFISFSLKLLPEQTTFLLDLEKMFVLQLNEIQKVPSKTSSILIDEENCDTFEFVDAEQKENVCDKEPFVIVGDTSESIPTRHGSRETLASNVDLPMIRLQRKFIYAKCDKFEEVKALLEAQRCKCRDLPPKPPTPPDSGQSTSTIPQSPSTTVESESSFEPLLMDDIEILQNCPGKLCQDWVKRYNFPYINNFLDYTEEKYNLVKTIIGKLPEKDAAPELINCRDIIWQEMPFAETHEKCRNIATQCSSEEDLSDLDSICPCKEAATAQITAAPSKKEFSKEIDEIMLKRKNSLRRVIHDNPKLLKLFTDESFDFIYTIP